MKEASKAARRRSTHINNVYLNTYFVGAGIDVGAGDDVITPQQYPNMTSVVAYDRVYGHTDAQYLPEMADNSFDFVHSSHCLEHCHDPEITLNNWLRVIKPGGHIVVCIPDDRMYEQGFWPSRFNGDHKRSFTMGNPAIPTSINVNDLLAKIPNVQILSAGIIDENYDYTLNVTTGSPFLVDQTYPETGPECAIEFVLRKNA
jgi:SAM-dependent methyltransferase